MWGELLLLVESAFHTRRRGFFPTMWTAFANEKLFCSKSHINSQSQSIRDEPASNRAWNVVWLSLQMRKKLLSSCNSAALKHSLEMLICMWFRFLSTELINAQQSLFFWKTNSQRYTCGNSLDTKLTGKFINTPFTRIATHRHEFRLLRSLLAPLARDCSKSKFHDPTTQHVEREKTKANLLSIYFPKTDFLFHFCYQHERHLWICTHETHDFYSMSLLTLSATNPRLSLFGLIPSFIEIITIARMHRGHDKVITRKRNWPK